MSQVAATMGITSEEIANGSESFELLKAKAKEMGASTKYTASEAAEGLNILAMAGLNATEATESIGDVLNLAGAGAMSLEQSASYLTGAVKGFNDEMGNSAYYADLMAKGATMANTSVSGLGEALSGVSATANAYKQSAESTSVALLRLAEQNVTGSEAATAMSRAMADLYTPTDKAQKALDKLGISTYDANGNARDFNDVVDELNGALANYSDEERLAYESTIFTTFGMKAFQKMTVSTTETVKKFKDGLKDAAGSAMQQYATQTDNLEGKMAILNSALEAVGIQVYEVFEDTMKNSVDTATDSVTRLQEEIAGGQLGKSLEHLSESLGNFVEEAIQLGEKALPVMIDGLAWVVDNLPIIIGAWGGYTAAIKAAEIAQLALNAAQMLMLNPAALLVPALGAVVGTMAALSLSCDEAGSSTEMAKRALEEMTSAAQSSMKGMSDAVQNAQKSFENLSINEKYVNSLKEQLRQLQKTAKEEGLTSDQRKLAIDIVKKLNDSVEGLNLAIDEETGLLIDDTEEWIANIDSRLEAAKSASALKLVTELTDSLAESDYNLFKIQDDLNRVRKEQNQLEYDYARISQSSILTEEQKGMALEKNRNELTALKKEEEGLVQTEEEYKNQIDETNNEIDKLSGYVKENTQVLDENKDSVEELTDSTSELAQEEEELSKAIEKETESLTSNIETQVNSFDKVKEAAALSKDEVLKNLKDQNASLEEWAENMQTLANRGVNDGILKELANMGPAGAAQVREFLKYTGDELSELNTVWMENAAISADTASFLANEYMTLGSNITQQFIDGAWQEIPEVEKVAEGYTTYLTEADAWNKLPLDVQEKLRDTIKSTEETAKEMETVGQDMSNSATEGFVKAQQENQSKIQDATTETTETIKTTLEDELESGSGVSEVAVRQGEGVDAGMVEGMSSKLGEVDTKAREVGAAARKGVGDEASKDQFYTIGAQATEGFAEGLADEEALKKVVEAAATIGKNAAEAARKQLDEHSPSKVFKQIGAFAVAGFSEGLDSMSVQSEMGRHIEAQLDNMVASVQPIGGAGDFNQTINVYSKSQTPDELAREIRLETKYGVRED